MKLFISFALLLCLYARLLPTNGSRVAESDIRFTIANAGLTVNGTLTGPEADIQFDPAQPEQARIRATVPASSIKTGISLRDRHLQKPEYFDAEHFPIILLQSVAVRKTGRGQYEGRFALTMKGIQREVKIPFTVSAANEFVGTLRLNRLDFHLGKESLILANEVNVVIRVKLAKAS